MRPRLATLLRGLLQIAACQIIARRVAKHMLQCPRLADVAAAAADGRHQLDLMVEVGGARRIRNRSAVRHHRVRGFGEEHRRLAWAVRAHLADVVGVIAADAVDAMHGKALICGGHRHARRGWRREGKLGHRM
jgi:hypothetical protein